MFGLLRIEESNHLLQNWANKWMRIDDVGCVVRLGPNRCRTFWRPQIDPPLNGAHANGYEFLDSISCYRICHEPYDDNNTELTRFTQFRIETKCEYEYVGGPASHSPTSSSSHLIVCCSDKWRSLLHHYEVFTPFTVPPQMGHLSAKYAFNHIRLNSCVRCASNVNCFLNKSDNCLWLAAKRYRIASYNVVARWPLG